MNTPTGLATRLARGLLRATVLAIYLTAAFAVAPALSSGPEVGGTSGQPLMADGILAVIGLMVVTLGTAVARWMREEPAA